MPARKQSSADLVWCGPIFDPSGYADEGRGLVCALDAAGIDVALRPVHRIAPGFREGLPAAERATLDRQAARSRSAAGVLVQHHTADAFFQMDGPTYHIGRTMFETDAIPPAWVRHCNQMDELWLPSEFNVATFREAGVHVPIVRVPGGIDSGQFNPDVPPMHVPGLRGTVFLAVFEWRRRKGWDVLLRAWADAFGPEDDVTLVLRTYPINKAAGRDNEAAINQCIDSFLQEACGRLRREVAPIVVLGRTVPGAEMPALYRIASAFVAPTRGEGWGRPFMEAMASGLPVLATRWSAHLEFMHEENSLLIDVDGLEEADAVEVPLYRGQRWAMPSASHLASLLQRVHQQPGEVEAIGRRARQEMVEQWPWSRAAGIMAERLRSIGEQDDLVFVAPQTLPDGPGLTVHGRFFEERAGDRDAERVVSALVRTWPAAVQVVSYAKSPRRPSAGSALIDAWRAAPRLASQENTGRPAAIGDAAGRPGLSAGTFGEAPNLVLTWLDRSLPAAPQRPAATRWVVCTGEVVSRSVPGHLVRVLRDQADEVWAPDPAAYLACRAIGIPDERLWLMPPVPPPDYITPRGPRAELPHDADAVFLLPALDAAQADDVESLLRLWQRVFDTNQSALLLVYAPRLGVASCDDWHGQLIDLLASGRLLHGAPIRVLRDGLEGDELIALVRSSDVLLDPLPAAATAAIRRMAHGCGRLVLEGPAPVADQGLGRPVRPAGTFVHEHSGVSASFDARAWRAALRMAADRVPEHRGPDAKRRGGAVVAATANLVSRGVRDASDGTPPPAGLWPGGGDRNELRQLGEAAVARLQAGVACAGSRLRMPSVLHLPQWPVPEARSVTCLAHVDWHNGSGGGVLRSYLEAFDDADDISLLLCLDPAQGLAVEDVQRIVTEASRTSRGRPHADIVLIPDMLTDEARARLLARSSAVVAVGDSRLAEWARENGRLVVDSLTRAAWRNLLATDRATEATATQRAGGYLKAG